MHLGHAKAICLNFGLAEEYADLGAKCHLRFDDTNPNKESQEYVDAIQRDVAWLGYNWGDDLYFASQYFEFFYQKACGLIEQGDAYVDEQTPEEISQNRGNLTEAGVASPFRDRSKEESLALFEKMKQGEIDEGKAVLRAKIDLTSSNMNLRDPIIFRIMKVKHQALGSDQLWNVYPMYDFAHPLEDACGMITHSLCTLEFENHRPLYNWVLEHCQINPKPRQIEFARLDLSYTIMSKRK